ncbi:hypothetical protein BD410DRAFT_173443 [Rickenella mellea]|uniref:HRDC domain-containing protein n=1 Tax=Rickenella mellea TaxID=50990 RepID=A0A4Y7Q6C8_9AGAM|nr:hypothetical protein BD410DRAFT_173443 [Rickenella mellea]
MAQASTSKSASISASDFDSHYADIQGAAFNATKLAAALPQDMSFHRSLDKDFAQHVDATSDRVLKLTNRLLALASTTRTSQAHGKSKLEDQDDVVDNFSSMVIDAVDHLYERVDMCLDEFGGRIKPAAIEVKPMPPKTKHNASRQGRLDPSLTHASHLSKPQLKFKRKVDNSNHTSWNPTLKHKYNAKMPLGYELQSVDVDMDYEMMPRGTHPYHHEITHISYPQRMFEHADAISPASFDQTPFTWVETKDAFEDMLEKLRKSQEIAVDLEHHSYRTFSGFLCLMQISTRQEDFVVDTLALREDLEDLNEVFTDPRIVKVFHGAESDIVWLQQDFNLYVVNLFDTYHASKVLDFPRHGLAALLAMYCDFIPDKRYQLADWRIRPLPEEMLQYARSDTHFLLYIYDNLRNALLDRGNGQDSLIRTVLERSEQTALRTYVKEVYDFETGTGPGGWDTLSQKWNKSLSGMQMAVFRCVHAWRDKVARSEDESTRYVLPNHYLFELAERPPADMAGLLASFRPVPPVIRTRAKELLDVIRETVKENLSSSAQLSSTKAPDTVAPVHAEVEVDPPLVPVSIERSSTIDVKEAIDDQARLWSNEQPGRSIVATLSSFLGRSTASAPPNYYSTKSVLFPPTIAKASSSSVPSRYQEVVARIHGALVIAPSVPKVLLDATKDLRDSGGDGKAINSQPVVVPQSPPSEIPEQIEIPFVPASQRQAAPTIDDTVVVVGQARQKKRKRVKQPTGDQSNESTPGPNTEATVKKKAKTIAQDEPSAEELEPFDYASAPNILDDQSGSRATDVKKSRQRKGGNFDYGDFPAPPRAHSELKGGNRSQTFR